VKRENIDLDALVKEVCIFAERAYRRGFQHGHLSGTSEEGEPWLRLSREEVETFRSEKTTFRRYREPLHPGQKVTNGQLERHAMQAFETRDRYTPILARLLGDAERVVRKRREAREFVRSLEDQLEEK